MHFLVTIECLEHPAQKHIESYSSVVLGTEHGTSQIACCRLLVRQGLLTLATATAPFV
jgi:hypothetical protein